MGLIDHRCSRALVIGAAGTGKTFAAREVITGWAEQGRSVLVLCATDPLARWWERQAPDGVMATSVPRLCRQLLDRADTILDEDDPEYWDELPMQAADAISVAGDGWDAVLVDGASDLSESAWEFADRCAMGGVLWACLDPHREFWPDRGVPDTWFDETFELHTVRRAPPLQSLALRYVHDVPSGPDELPASLELACDQPADEVVTGLLDEGLQPHEVGVVSLRGRREHRGAVHQRRGWPAAVGGSSRYAEERLVVETFLRFAGLERPTIVVTDLDLVEDRYGQRMYVALTRATERVIVCAPSEVLERDEVLKRGL